MITRPLTQTAPIITAAEFAAWVGVSNTDPLIPMLSTTATDMIVNYLDMELIDRERQVIYKDWPSIGTNTAPSLSRNNIGALRLIELPYSHTAVTGVTVLIDGQAETVELVEGKPFAIYTEDYSHYTDEEINAIIATYTTGFGTIDDVPTPIKQAALVLSAYMYEHRGECDASQMLKMSGAADLIQTYKADVVVM